ncbi:MAG: hypothetical protein Q9182_004704, partial [Xanthomendoza sp. 2 TL-2023]
IDSPQYLLLKPSKALFLPRKAQSKQAYSALTRSFKVNHGILDIKMGMFEDCPVGKSPKSMDRPALGRHFYRGFPPEDATLLVVDSISTPFNHAFALSNKHVEGKTSGKKNDVAQWAAGRRWAVMGDLISAFGKLAATRNMAIVLTGQTTTKTKLENAAQLQPVMSGTTWECGINTRILLYRDWQEAIEEKPLHERGEIPSDLRLAAAIKINGVSLDGLGEIVPFTIDIVRTPYMLVHSH